MRVYHVIKNQIEAFIHRLFLSYNGMELIVDLTPMIGGLPLLYFVSQSCRQAGDYHNEPITYHKKLWARFSFVLK